MILKKEPLVSVIIPAYNSEVFLEKCLNSVLNQTYKNFEIIIVNDGSTDKTALIGSEYALKHDNVFIFNKQNGGLCSARLFGWKKSRGDYIVFLDSDDYWEVNFIEELVRPLNYRLDEIVMCDFLKNGKKESESHQYLVMKHKTEIFHQFLCGGIYNRTVNKIYPRSLISESDFPVGMDMLEDAYFTSHILEKCNSVIRIPYAGYNYVRHPSSMSKAKLSLAQQSSMFCNLFEKDIILFRNIPSSDYRKLYDIAVEHLKSCMRAVKDFRRNGLFDKILKLLNLFSGLDITDINCDFLYFMSKSSTISALKRRFMIYSIFKDSWKNKFLFLKSTLRKIFTRR